MLRVTMYALKNAKQLRALCSQKVVSVNFEDEAEKHFCIMFQLEDGKYRDLCIFFDGRYPRFYITEPYEV